MSFTKLIGPESVDGNVGGYRYGTALTNIKSLRSLRSPFATIKDAKKKRKSRRKRRTKRRTKRRNKKRKIRRRKSYRKRK